MGLPRARPGAELAGGRGRTNPASVTERIGLAMLVSTLLVAVLATASPRGVTGFGVENLAKKDKSGQPETYNSEGKKIQLYSFLEAETAAYVSSICFLNLSGPNRCRL